jgi:dihydrolipoamide dehydrogenase
MKKISTDVVIIGSGTAGLNARRAVLAQGKKVIMLENGPYGTTCARVGCMPSKLLIAAADAAHEARLAPAFGVHPGRIRIDGEQVMERVRSERDRFVSFVLDAVDNIPASQKMRGTGRFVSPTEVQVDDHTVIKAKKGVVIATGSKATIPKFLEPAVDRVIINDDVFDWAGLPESIAVFGTGVIALELGQALHRLGVRVTVFGRSGKYHPLRDPAVQQSADDIFTKELHIVRQAKVNKVSRNGGGAVKIEYLDGDAEESRSYDWVLAATGRAPNISDLNLAEAGFDLDDSGLPIFDPDTLQLGDHPVFLAGDVTNERQLLHEAADEGKIAGKNAALFPTVEAGKRRAGISVTFSDPNIAIVGTGYESLPPGTFVTGKVNFGGQGRSRVMLRNAGILHVYADKVSRRFLGAEHVGPRAEHIAHLLAWSLQSGLTIDEMLAMPFYHPVIEEGLRTALQDAASKLNAQ